MDHVVRYVGPGDGVRAEFDDPEYRACLDLIQRSGSDHFEITCEYDPDGTARCWQASARFRGARLMNESCHVGPIEAMRSLVRRVTYGARCLGCDGLVSLTPELASVPSGVSLFGVVLTKEDAVTMPVCHWRLIGDRFEAGCAIGKATTDVPSA